jgi:hypothetical protein
LGGASAALGPFSGALISGAGNSLMGAIDGTTNLKKLGTDFMIGAAASLVGSGIGKAAEKIGGKIAIKSLSKLSKTQLKSKIISKIPNLKGAQRNSIKSIAYLANNYSDKLIGKTMPQIFNSSTGSALGYGLQRLLY